MSWGRKAIFWPARRVFSFLVRLRANQEARFGRLAAAVGAWLKCRNPPASASSAAPACRHAAKRDADENPNPPTAGAAAKHRAKEQVHGVWHGDVLFHAQT